jgi:predicted dehydrogenase
LLHYTIAPDSPATQLIAGIISVSFSGDPRLLAEKLRDSAQYHLHYIRRKPVSVRVGVIGVGYLGQHHARIFSGLEDVELVAVCDVDRSRCDSIASAFACRSVSGYQDLLEKCDALSIVTPTTTHYDIAMDCLAAGRDIFIEKPLTDTMDCAGAILEKAEKKNLIVQVGHLERYNPGFLAAAGMIKEPRFIEAERLSPFLGRATDVDVTLDLMIHDIDIVMYIAGSKPKDIRAAGESFVTDKIDVAKAWLEFEGGCKALLSASRIAQEKKRSMRIFQDNSHLSVDYQTQEVRRSFMSSGGIAVDVVRPEGKEPLREELKDFIFCVKNRTKPRVSAAEAAAALEVVIRINELVKGPSRLEPSKIARGDISQ